MGQSSDTTNAEPEIHDSLARKASNLLQSAVAIDPPPRGALGIRDLLDLLEKEIAREFPAAGGSGSSSDQPTVRRARKRA